MQYIDKDVIAAELRKRIQESIDAGGATRGVYLSERMKEDSSILSFIDTIEAKEVDLEKELDEWMKYGPHTSYPWCTIPDAIKITAEHFFELGLKAKKGE